MTTFNADMQQKVDPAATWTANNPTLRDGELGFEEDTGKWKLGDGVTAWNSLGYFGAGSVAYDNGTSGLTATDLQAAVDELATDDAAIASAVSDHLGDTDDAHDGSAVSFTDAGLAVITGVDVQAALAAVDAALDDRPTNAEASAAYWPAPNAGDGNLVPLADIGGASLAMTNERLWAVGFWIPAGKQVTGIGFQVASAGEASSVVRLGTATPGSDGWPDAITDHGTVATASTGTKTITGLTVARPASGYLWALAAVQSASTTPPGIVEARNSRFPIVGTGSAANFAGANGDSRKFPVVLSGISGALAATWPAGRTFGTNTFGPAPGLYVTIADA